MRSHKRSPQTAPPERSAWVVADIGALVADLEAMSADEFAGIIFDDLEPAGRA